MPGIVKMTAAVHPFKANHKDLEFEEGVTIKEMIEVAQPDQKQVKHALVFVRGEIIPREAWHKYRPKAGDIIEARAFPVPMGGGGGKDILRIVLIIAVMVFAMWAAPFVLGAMGFSAATIAAGGLFVSFMGALVTGVIATVGMLAVNALVPVKQPKLDALTGTSGTSESPTLFIEGARNSINPFSPVPVVLGKYRRTPNLGSKPYTEISGDNQYVRMLFIWGIGPLSIDLSTIKIGETPITDFTDYQLEHREGYSTDDPLTLFPSAINQEDFTVLLTETLGWVSRTSTIYADELSVDISFPSGLVTFDESGNKASRSVTVEFEYRETGTSPWLKIDTSDAKFQTTVDASWLNKSGDSLTSITFTQARTAAIRHGLRWGVPSQGQYDIRMRRTTPTPTSTQIYDTTAWSTLRTITASDPVNSPVPVAKTAIVIKATDQLNGVIDEFNAIVTTVCKDWDTDTSTWIERATQNPASLFRYVLQGNGMAEPLLDARIDLDALQDWHEFCVEKGFTFNMVRDFNASVWETLADVASAGRAAPTQIDGKWSVVIDREQASPVSFITPRNSFDFKADKFFLNPPDGWRIRFPNEDQGYTFDERRVYRDGFTELNATKFESLELPGVTDPDQIYRLGRFRIAQGLNQPERWSFKQDMEYLTYKRGDRVVITHDIMLVGLKSGRIKGLVLDGANITGFVLDEEVTMEEGQTYGIAIRTLYNAKVTAQVVTVAGSSNSITLSAPIAGTGSPAEPVVAIGDIFGFGLFGSESDDATIISISPASDLKAQVIAIPYRPVIYSADTEEIPEFVTRVTPLVAIPAPVVVSTVSDESVMVISATGNLKIRIMVNFNALNKERFGSSSGLHVQMRPTGLGSPYYDANIEEKGEGFVIIGDVKTGEEYDIRMNFTVPGRLPGPWTVIPAYRVVGKSTPAGPLTGMTISVFGGSALIRWEKPTELDVVFGGEVVFRHSPSFDGASWGESVTIGQSARARTLFAVLPLKPGTYLARVYDVDGNPSDEVTTVTTKQASVHAFANLDSIDEADTFLGSHSNTENDGGVLKLTEGSPRVLSGTYTFAQGFDFTTVQNVRLTTRVAVAAYSISDEIDARLDSIDSWEDFDGSIQAGADARVFVRHTDTDPEASPVVWTAWERLDSAEFEARAFQFKIELSAESDDYNIAVSELGIDADQIA
jgi:sulfur carrier protein ThiS